MPLRDHFDASADDTATWQELHAMWPAMIVLHLTRILPKGYVAAPRVHIGKEMEIDLAALERPGAGPTGRRADKNGNGGGATAVVAPPVPTVEFDSAWPDQDTFETRVYETSRGRRLVAAIELVSPANKDRPDNRRAFVTKCAALLQNGVSVSIVDLVTSCEFNLGTDLMELIRRSDPIFSPDPPPIYTVTCRARTQDRRTKVAVWANHLAVGKELPALPIWLTEELSVILDLETSYEETCRVLQVV